MSQSTAVEISRDGPLAILTMQLAPHNLLGTELMQALEAALVEAQAAGARAILLRSGLKHFSAGADPALLSEAIGKAEGLSVSPVAFLKMMERFPLPIVAEVHGVCVGGGFELALTCDFIIAARSAKIGSVEVTLGLNPLMGAVQRQVARAGAMRAKEISLLGRRYDAETLERWNLINRVVDDAALPGAARAVALELANGPTVAHMLTKELARLAEDQGVAAADARMEELQSALWTSEDLKTGFESMMKNGPGIAQFKGK